eukprot:459806_1
MDPLLNVQNMAIVILYALHLMHVPDPLLNVQNMVIVILCALHMVLVILLISHGQKNGTGNITCGGEYACSYVTFPQPPPFEDMVLNCNEEGECYRSIIKCPEYGNCHIMCSAYGACYSANITWPKNGTGNITCDGEYACSYVTFPQPPP